MAGTPPPLEDCLRDSSRPFHRLPGRRVYPISPPCDLAKWRSLVEMEIMLCDGKPMSILRILAIVFAASATLAAGNWPHWRGPSASGVSAEQNLPERRSETGTMPWKASLDGLAMSSPIVWGNRVFVTSQRENGVVQPGPRLMQAGNAAEAGERPLGSGATRGDGKVTFLVNALDISTGQRAWQFELPGQAPLPSVHEQHNLASPSPATDGQR